MRRYAAVSQQKYYKAALELLVHLPLTMHKQLAIDHRYFVSNFTRTTVEV